MVSIEIPELPFKAGDTLWFADGAVNEDFDAEDFYIYSGFVHKIDVTAVQKFGASVIAQMYVSLSADGDTGFIWRIGQDEFWNPKAFLTREEAILEARENYARRIAAHEEEIAKATRALRHDRRAIAAPLIETTAEIARNTKYLTTLKEKIAGTRA